LVEGAPERREVTALGGARPGVDDRRDLVEDPLVTRTIRLPPRAEADHRRAGTARATAERDDERQRPHRPERRDRRRLAAHEAEAGPECGRGGGDPRRMAVEDRLGPAAERERVVVRA